MGGQVCKTDLPRCQAGERDRGSGLQTGGSWCQAGNCGIIRGKFCAAWHLDMSFCRPDPGGPRRPGTAKRRFADL